MISVVIPTYKRPDRLERLLLSISKQTLLPEEVIIVDDASGMKNEYGACVEKFKHSFNSIQYIELEENSGAPTVRNTGIKLAKNEWIALVDDDDEWLPRKLEKQWAIASSAADRLGLIYTWTEAVGQKGQKSYRSCHSFRGDVRKQILTTNFIMSASVMVRKRAIVRSGLFDETLPSCQDWDMWTAMFLKGYHADVVEDIQTIYNRHGGESIGLSANAKKGYLRFINKYWFEIFKQTGPINWLKKSLLFFKMSLYTVAGVK
ncbi:glycosyltransferase family 2 protein [Vibrio splendidus]